MQRTLPPADGEGGVLPAAHERAIERIREALQRGNYILCIDSPETIGRPQTVHHGTPRLLHEGSDESHPGRFLNFAARVERFFNFLVHLIAWPIDDIGASDIGESYVCVGFAPASPRHAILNKPPSETLNLVDGYVASLKEICERDPCLIDAKGEVPSDKPSPDEGGDEGDLLRRLVDLLLLDRVDNPLRVDLKGPLVAMILSVLRRPRSHLAYLTLLNCPSAAAPATGETASSFWDKLFDYPPNKARLADFPHRYSDGSNYLGGSLLWIPRRIHNRAYSRLTDVGHRVAADVRNGRTGGPKPGETAQAVLSLLASAILHRRAGRYYFSEVYEATGDITAFREYIYHRISYLRLLCRLLVLSKPWEAKPDSEPELRERLTRSLRRYHFPTPWPPSEAPDHTARDDVPQPWGTIRLGLRSAWSQELKAFRATLSREFEAVRRDLYADTWVSIIDRIRDFDVEEMWDEKSFRISHGTDDPNGALCDQERKYLKDDLRRQELEALFEMADWQGTLDAQRQSLKTIEQAFAKPLAKGRHDLHPLVDATLRGIVAILPEGHALRQLVETVASGRPTKGEKPTPTAELVKAALPPPPRKGRAAADFKGRTPADFVRWFMKLLEMAEGYSRLARVYHEIAVPRGRKPSAPALATGDDTADGPDKSAAKSRDDHQEAAVLVVGCLKEWLGKVEELNRVGKIAPFSDEIQQFLRTRLTILSLDLVEDQARFGFDKYNPWWDRNARAWRDPRRTAMEEPKAWLEGTRTAALDLFEQTRRTVFQDVGTYNRYRAKSLRMVARCAVLAAKEPGDFQRPVADLNLALRLLRRGRSADHLEEVACYRAKAEALLIWGDVLARGDALARTDRRLANGPAARARLAASRSMLGRALAAFDGRRRNVPWWLRLCGDRAQWAVVSCVLRVWEARVAAAASEASGSPGTETHERFRLAFESDLRYGLDAVRAGLDCILPVRGRNAGTPEAIVVSTEAHWKGFVRLWLSLGQAAWAFEAPDEPAKFKTYWEAVNRAARLPNLFKIWAAESTSGPLGPGDFTSRDYSALFDDIVPTEGGWNLVELLEGLLQQFR